MGKTCLFIQSPGSRGNTLSPGLRIRRQAPSFSGIDHSLPPPALEAGERLLGRRHRPHDLRGPRRLGRQPLRHHPRRGHRPRRRHHLPRCRRGERPASSNALSVEQRAACPRAARTAAAPGEAVAAVISPRPPWPTDWPLAPRWRSLPLNNVREQGQHRQARLRLERQRLRSTHHRRYGHQTGHWNAVGAASP